MIRARRWPLAAGLMVGLLVIGCGKTSRPETSGDEERSERTIGKATTPRGTVEYVCVVGVSRTVGFNFGKSGCGRLYTARLGDAEAFLVAGQTFQNCAKEREQCSAEQGSVAARQEADGTVAAAMRGTRDSSGHALYFVAGQKRPIRWRDAELAEPTVTLATMPALDVAITQRLSGQAPEPAPVAGDKLGDVDGLWDVLEEPARMTKHLAEVTARVKACKLPERALQTYAKARGVEAVPALYEASKQFSCSPAKNYLTEKRPPAVSPLLVADLKQELKNPTHDRWLHRLAQVMVPPEAGPLLDKRLRDLEYRADLPYQVEDNGTWFTAAQALVAIDRRLGTKALVERLRSVPRDRTEDKFPEITIDPSDGYAPNTAFYAAAVLRAFDSPDGRASLGALLDDATQSKASRTMAFILLRLWGDPRGSKPPTGITLSQLQEGGLASAKPAR